ncbi:MAG: serine hydrolase [Bacteroidota bacterium]
MKPARAAVVRILALISILVADAPAQDFSRVSRQLSDVIESELKQKGIPAAYIALVNDQSVVWSAAFGYSDLDRKLTASPTQVHRIASVSKLFTDIAVMQLAERGLLDIDAPVTTYVPEFQPRNPFGIPLTLRQIMTHRAGIVREPPVGHYMDPTEPSLAQTILSLNQTEIVYKPETRFKYSNAGIALVGYVLEKMQGQPFGEYIERYLLKPLGMNESSFLPKKELLERKPRALLWTYDGRTFDVPTFQFGMAPAANMYSTIGDLGTFMIALFNKGETGTGRILKEETLEEMWRPQFVPEGEKSGAGLGFFVEEFEGERLVSHSGDVYGFATEFAAMPDRKVGVIVVNTMNACNDWSSRIARYALRLMQAQKKNAALPPFGSTTPVDPRLAKLVSGTYRKGSLTVEISYKAGTLFMQGRTMKSVVRQRENTLVVDDKHNSGTTLIPVANGLVLGADTLLRVTETRPQEAPDRWKGLIGEYGWDHNVLYIHERNGILHAQIEWYFSYPLREISNNVFAFPEFGLYHGEKIVFTRDSSGNGVLATAANIGFVRRAVGTAGGQTFRINPQHPIEQLRQSAMKASPSVEGGVFKESDLVDLRALDSTIRFDIRYATTNNFMNAVFYSEPRAYLQRPAARAVALASAWLKQFGYGLIVYDAYRPWYVTKMFWDATPDHQRDFVADPSKGSRHNRGCAVDIGLYDLRTGALAPMVSGYDEFSVRAYPEYPGESSLQRWNRELLRTALEQEGFAVYEYEWWHFDFQGWEHYRIMNVAFDGIPVN